MDCWGCREIGVADGLEVEEKGVDVRVLLCVSICSDIECVGHADYSICFFEEFVGRCGGRGTRLPLRDCGACMFVLEESVDI
jgi:hypothetical protein